MEYKFERNRSDKIPKSEILEQLEKVAQKKNFVEFSTDEFNELADISAGTVKNEFGSWLNALKALKEHLNKKGIEFIPRKSRSQLSLLTDKELFDEMERIWKQLGHRPSRIEWESSNPKINHGVFRYRFNGWANACLKFIEYKMGTAIIITEKQGDAKEDDGILVKKAENNVKFFLGKTFLQVSAFEF